MGAGTREQGELRPGIEGRVEEIVASAMTAPAMGSGDVPVLATPAVVALCERAAVIAVAATLPDGATTVGSRIEVWHTAPTPVGVRVTAVARLEEVKGRRLLFACSVTDETGQVASGTHERVIVDRATFAARSRDRASRPGGRGGVQDRGTDHLQDGRALAPDGGSPEI